MNKRTRARRAALQALYQWQITAQSPTQISIEFQEESRLENVDRELFELLLRDVASQSDELDSLLADFVDRAVSQIDPVERAVLRLGTYELRSCPEVPWRVVINESVELARTFGADQSHRYVNAVLDKLARTLRTSEVAAG